MGPRREGHVQTMLPPWTNSSRRDSQASEGMTAVENLRLYEKFAQAHVTHLKKLTTAFDTLYTSMPPTQQKVADQVFQNFGHNKGGAAHG